MPKPLLCNPKPFKDQFRRDTKERKERRYCFILGAGASVSSGIPSGKSLADQWLRELYDRQCPASAPGNPPVTLEQWCASDDCPVSGINPKNPGAHYPQLFLARFPGPDPEGQRFIQEAIRGSNHERPNVPSVGYAYLALILQQTDSRVVITTNFDNLAADALLLFTGSLPRVVGHERVAAFAGLRDGQPLIAKIHGDVGFVTANDPDGVSKLHNDWAVPLREIFRDHIPIFIGYDGNDGSLMDFFCKELSEVGPGDTKRSLLRSGLYWCYRAGDGMEWKTKLESNVRLKALAESHQVHFVPIGDFDLWLMELGIACGVGDPEKILKENVERRVKALAEQIGKARADQADKAQSPEVEASRADVREEIGSESKEWDLAYRAIEEKDPFKADSLYRQALGISPNSPGILGNYAVFLKKIIKDYDKAQIFYERAIKADPNHANNLGNYASFLREIRNDTGRALEFFERAIKAEPNNVNLLGNFANFLAQSYKEYDRAQELYEKILKIDPNHTNTLGNYALFLERVRKDYERAQEFYDRAVKIDPNHINNVGNYARFLEDIRKDNKHAKELYERVIKADPQHANNLGNYARFLDEVIEDYDHAQDFYERAIKANPNHATNLGNYALFFENSRKDYDRAEEFYKRAIETDSSQANNLSNYALFLEKIRKNYALAENYHKRAIAADSTHANSLGNYAVFLENVRKDYDQAEKFYGDAIKADPHQANILSNYALFLVNIRKDHKRMEELSELALKVDPYHANTLGNYALFLTTVRKDYNRAQEFYARAIKVNPNHANLLCNYALFLANIRGEYERAKGFYQRAIEIDSDHANSLGNYAGMLLAQGDTVKGLPLLAKAIKANASSLPALNAELWFYAFLHQPSNRQSEAISKLKAFILRGDRSLGWDFSRNIQRATGERHPDAAWLPKLAQVIDGDADPAILDAWPTWANA